MRADEASVIMKPTLLQIVEAYPDISINIKLSDLLEAFRQIAEEIQETRENERAAEEKDILITREDAMEQLGVSSSTLWRWNQENYLKPVKIGVKARYHQSDIDKLKQKYGR